MLRYDVRFWDKANNRLIYGAGISPNQLPIVQHTDGHLEELKGEFVPMLSTGQKALNGVIFEADVIECDVPVFADQSGKFQSFLKARGVMQFNQQKGAFTLNIAAQSQAVGGEFQVTNSRIIGCAVSNPELLTINPNQNEQITNQAQSSSDKKDS